MPDWLIGLAACAGSYLACDLVAVAALWIVHRLWGDSGVAWVLGRTEVDVRQMGRPRDPESGTTASASHPMPVGPARP